MKKIAISTFMGALLGILLSLALVSAAANFTVTLSISKSVDFSNSEAFSVTVSNIGDEELDIRFKIANPKNGSKTIKLTPTPSSVNDLEAGDTSNVVFVYTAPSTEGVYIGSITFRSRTNSSLNATTLVNLSVRESGSSVLTLEDDNENDILEMEGEIDEEDSHTFRIKNKGQIDLENVRVEFSDLEGLDSGDNIDRDEISIDDSNDKKFDLRAGRSRSIRIDIDVPRDIRGDIYEGTMTVSSDQLADVEFDIELDVGGGNEEIDIDETIIKVRGETGDSVSNVEFEVINNGNIRVDNIEFELDGDFEERFSDRTLPKSIVSFHPSSVDLDVDEEDDVEVIIDIPTDTPSGTYSAKIRAVSEIGNKRYDDLTLELRVTSDLYIKTPVVVPETVVPGQNLNVEVVIVNSGSRFEDNIRVTGKLRNVDIDNSDIIESNSPFDLDSNSEHSEFLRFHIPEGARDGTHTLEVRVRYDDGDLVELEDVEIRRANHNIKIESYGVTPGVVKCGGTVFSFMKVKNLGRFDEKVQFETEVVGEKIQVKSGLVDLYVDDSTQDNSALRLEGLDDGSYVVEQRVRFNGLVETRTSNLRVTGCNKAVVDTQPPTIFGEGDEIDSNRVVEIMIEDELLELAQGESLVIEVNGKSQSIKAVLVEENNVSLEVNGENITLSEGEAFVVDEVSISVEDIKITQDTGDLITIFGVTFDIVTFYLVCGILLILVLIVITLFFI